MLDYSLDSEVKMNWLHSVFKCFGYPDSEQQAAAQRSATQAKYRFETIRDNYKSIQEVQQALREAGLESSNLIVGIDFTGSNAVSGEKSFDGRCLHDVTGPINPYQQVIGIVGRTLEVFDDDHLIPAYGFGDVVTRDKSCFPFFADRPCNGLHEVLTRYQEIAPGFIV
jgi:E3 ubiquitin-protein ligase RGLG